MSLRLKPLTLLLAASLAVNLFFGGLYFGRALFGERHHRSEHHGGRGDAYTLRLELRALHAALGEDGRLALRESMRANRADLGPKFEAIRANRDAVTALLVAEPLDRVALEAAFAGLNASLVDLQQPLQDIIVGAAEQMTAAERARMAQALEDMRADINRRYERRRAEEETRERERR